MLRVTDADLAILLARIQHARDVISREAEMRQRVFEGRPSLLASKMDEMNFLRDLCRTFEEMALEANESQLDMDTFFDMEPPPPTPPKRRRS